MSVPAISPLPALPTFPAGPGLPDQPAVFIPQFLDFLNSLGTFGEQANAIAAYLDGLGSGTVAASDPDEPRFLSYGNRARIETDPDALALIDTLHTAYVGFASNAYAGTTGGLGKPVVYVNDPSLSRGPLYSFGRAIDALAANSGGLVYFDTDGFFPVILSDQLDLTGLSDFTLWAPGRNVAFNPNRLNGALLIGGSNIIVDGFQFRPNPGPINGTVIGTDESTAATIIQCRKDQSDQLVFANLEGWHPSWHWLDVTDAPSTATVQPACRVTVQNCILWNAIQGHLVGTKQTNLGPGTYSADTDTRELFITFYRNVYAYCLQRLPKVLGRTYADVVENYFLMAPYPNEYDDTPEIMTDVYAGGTTDGGQLNMRGCLIRSAHPMIDGGTATQAIVGPLSGASGRIRLTDCAAENGLVLTERNASLVPDPPYTLPHSGIPAPGAPRKAWTDMLWAGAGARVDPAPEGRFKLVEGSARIPNGEVVVLDDETDRSRMLERLDTLREYGLPAAVSTASPIIELPLANAITIASDTITIPADQSYFTVNPQSGTADDLLTINGGVDGRVIIFRPASATYEITLKQGGNILLTTGNTVVLRNRRAIALIYDIGSSQWVLWEPEVIHALTVANLPTVGTIGRRRFVTDATATTFNSVVAGTGANKVPVYDDGTNWRIG